LLFSSGSSLTGRFMFPPDLPPVKNRALYVCRVLSKWLAFFTFGVGAVFIVLLVFPLMRLAFLSKARFQKHGRRFISHTCRFFIFFMRCIKMADMELEGQTGALSEREKYLGLSSKIVVANHPSLIDPLLLLSLMPNADTIVIPYRNNLILGGVIRQLYIQGSEELEDVLESGIKSLREGNCLMIFPEGTRTRRAGKVILKKGAARLALASGCTIVPVHIGGTDKFGLGKKDPWAGYNPQERYVYRLSMGPEISPENYRHLPAPAAAKAMTEEIASFLFPDKQAKRHAP